MRILSWNTHISANPCPHWSIQVKTGNGENHLAELTRAGFNFGGHNKPAGAVVSDSGGASNRTWGELSAFLQDYKKRNAHYDLLQNNCVMLTNAVKAFLKG